MIGLGRQVNKVCAATLGSVALCLATLGTAEAMAVGGDLESARRTVIEAGFDPAPLVPSGIPVTVAATQATVRLVEGGYDLTVEAIGAEQRATFTLARGPTAAQQLAAARTQGPVQAATLRGQEMLFAAEIASCYFWNEDGQDYSACGSGVSDREVESFVTGLYPGEPLSPPSLQNPPVIYVHGVTEHACGEGNMRAVLDQISTTLSQSGLPDAGADCGGREGRNPLRFSYVQDREGFRDQDLDDGGEASAGASQSGAGRNAAALRDQINILTMDGGKVSLVGFSFGGLIIRTYLAQYAEEADERVAAVAFIESAHQGSLWARGGAPEAVSGCTANLNLIPEALANPLCEFGLNKFREEFDVTEGALAFRDLAPQSEAVQAAAQAPLPRAPRYLNLPGDLRLRVWSRLGVGSWTIREPRTASLGDVIIPLGEPDPGATPSLGGASFLPSTQEFSAREIPLQRTCVLPEEQTRSLIDGFIARLPGSRLVGRVNQIRCLAEAPEAHYNINNRSGEITLGRDSQTLPRVVTDFLVNACREESLGACERVVGPGESCGSVTATAYAGAKVSSNLIVEAGSTTCTQARRLWAGYWNGLPVGSTVEPPVDLCDSRGAGTCYRVIDGWSCVVPTTSADPKNFSCSQLDGRGRLAGY